MQFRSILVLKGINIIEFITRRPNFEHCIPYHAIYNGVDMQAIALRNFSTAAFIDCFIKLFIDGLHSRDVAKRRFEMVR
jgi:hypothetical protein